MSWKIDQSTGDIVIDGWEQGIATSPHKGIANIQNANISTETNEVMASFKRIQQSQGGDTSTNHEIDPVDTSHLSTAFSLLSGSWINITASTISGLSTGNYYVQNSTGTASGGSAISLQLSSFYNSSPLSGFGATGTATFNLIRVMAAPLASATEPYNNGTQQYRYYILDNQGLVWVYDTASSPAQGTLNWFLPDYALVAGATGIGILNGWLHIFVNNLIFCKSTVNLGDSTANSTVWSIFASGQILTSQTHFAYSGHQGRMYWTDGNYIGSIFPNTSLLSSTSNVQSYASYTGSGTTGTISRIINGSIPYNGSSNSFRIPAVFFHSLTASGANPAALSIGTIYYIKYLPSSSGFTDNSTFEVYAAEAGGMALDVASGSVGTQYFSTYYPVSSGGEATITFTPEALNLPFYETAISMSEVGSTVVIGTRLNTLYPWNQVDVTPSDLIPLPENNATFMLTVNNMAYIFAGNKGNVYVTNGSTASLVLTVPDYCAGIAGTPSSYIEPYFVWGGAAYVRGRVYFSILDQTSTKAGNCGGVWSFIPTQNFFIGQDTGLSLRLENQNSYGTYNGYCPVILASQVQNVRSPQFWSSWQSSTSSPTYGIDFTDTVTASAATIETDLIPTGTMLKKETFKQIEYKLAAPLVSGDSVSISYRLNASDSYVALANLNTDSPTSLSGYYPASFEKGQWLQLKVTLAPLSGTNSSFVRLTELRIR